MSVGSWVVDTGHIAHGREREPSCVISTLPHRESGTSPPGLAMHTTRRLTTPCPQVTEQAPQSVSCTLYRTHGGKSSPHSRTSGSHPPHIAMGNTSSESVAHDTPRRWYPCKGSSFTARNHSTSFPAFMQRVAARTLVPFWQVTVQVDQLV